MASKQIGKLRQWAGEVMSSREKTLPTEDFLDLERDVEVRKNGLEKLQIVTNDYHYSLSRKKFSEALANPEKVLAIDALGVVMIGHGEELGHESAYGSSLVSLGRAHCRVAALQDTYALTLGDTFIGFLKQYASDLSDYTAQRKKYDSRRLAYDAAINKAEKTFKKDKDKKEAEEELQVARLRFEETAQDVIARMHDIQNSETIQLRELTGFLDLEIKYVSEYLDILLEVKENWAKVPDTPNRPARPAVKTHTLSQTSINTEEIAKMASPSASRPSLGLASKFNSIRSFRSTKSPKVTAADLEADEASDDADSPNVEAATQGLSRKKSQGGIKTPSRPASRQQQRKRADSTITAEEDTDGVDRKDKDKKPKRMSVSGWMGSVTGRGKNKVADKDKFATLNDEDDEDEEDETEAAPIRPRSAMSNRSTKSKGTPNVRAALSRSQSMRGKERKVMRALYAFSGGSGELTFDVGDEIIVLNEVVDDWWMGELDGNTGLFPANYTVPAEVSRPTLPSRSKSAMNTTSISNGLGKSIISPSSRFPYSSPVDGKNAFLDDLSPRGDVFPNSDDEHHPFGDYHRQPSGLSRQVPQDGFDANSIASRSDDEEYGGEVRLVQDDFSLPPSPIRPTLPSRAPASAQVSRSSFRNTYNAPPASVSSGSISAPSTAPSFTANTNTKRPPPPVPPPRQPSSTKPAPPLPARNPLGSRTQSAASIPSSVSTMSTTSSASVPGPGSAVNLVANHHHSPFISQSELSFDVVAMTGTTVGEKEGGCRVDGCGCTTFRQNPFQPSAEGACTNCFHPHMK